MARLQAIQRRTVDTSADPVFSAGPLKIDFENRMVWVDHKEVSLSSTEYALLRLLAQHLGKVITHKQLLREVWGTAAEDRSQYLRVYMTHLRKKIEGPAGKRMIKTEVGIGYRLFA
jgi:two-component system KDP operon response regulator KdpE